MQSEDEPVFRKKVSGIPASSIMVRHRLSPDPQIHCMYPSCSSSADLRVDLTTREDGQNAVEAVLCTYHHNSLSLDPGLLDFVYKITASTDALDRVSKSAPSRSLRKLTRDEYLKRVQDELAKATSFRGAYLASCFHPDWFYDLQKAAESKAGGNPGSSAMDRAVRNLLHDPDRDVAVIIRIRSETYAQKIASVTRDRRLLAILAEDTILAAADFFQSPQLADRVACMDIGHERIPYIFERVVTTAQRREAASRVDYAIMSDDPEVVEFERRGFNLLMAGHRQEKSWHTLFSEHVLEAVGLVA